VVMGERPCIARHYKTIGQENRVDDFRINKDAAIIMAAILERLLIFTYEKRSRNDHDWDQAARTRKQAQRKKWHHNATNCRRVMLDIASSIQACSLRHLESQWNLQGWPGRIQQKTCIFRQEQRPCDTPLAAPDEEKLGDTGLEPVASCMSSKRLKM